MANLQNDPKLLAIAELLTDAEATAADLAIEIRGLTLAYQRRMRELDTGRAPGIEDESVPVGVMEWRTLSRTDAVLRMLREAGGQLHRKDLTTRLNKAGRADDIEAVSAALAYLAREPNPRVAAMGNGFWQLYPPIYDSGPAGDAIRRAYAAGEDPEGIIRSTAHDVHSAVYALTNGTIREDIFGKSDADGNVRE